MAATAPPNGSKAAFHLPGLDAALAGPETADESLPGATFADAHRIGANAWALTLAEHSPVGQDHQDDLRRRLRAAAARFLDPVDVLRAVDESLRAAPWAPSATATAVQGLVEHDRCGAWITIACADHPLPIVVRRAGWIDVRGQPGGALGSGERLDVAVDRVGLGPGDAFVMCSPGIADARDHRGEPFAAEHLPDLLLRSTSCGASELTRRVVAACRAYASATCASSGAGDARSSDQVTVVLRVPEDLGEDPDERLAGLLGVPEAKLPLPGYPVGMPHWGPSRRPLPPRQARLRLSAERVSIPTARRFVDSVLHSWRMSELAGDAVALATSELVTNAVRHGGTGFVVIVAYDGESVRVEVGDGSRALPEPRQASELDVGGRGLAIVEALAADWGVLATLDGKRVWFTVPAPA